MRRLRYSWGLLLIFFVFIGCSPPINTYPVHIAGVVVEKDITKIDTIRGEYWLKIVIQTEGGTRHVVSVGHELYEDVNVGDYLSIMFKRNGEIDNYAYGKKPT